MTRLAAIVVLYALGCAPGPVRPVAIDTAHDTCDNCRMVISDVHYASQVIAAGEEPRLFDDVGCLRAFLHTHTPDPGATIFVADHRTGGWVDATRAVYTRTVAAATPMGSRIVAHADPASRDADPAAAGGESVPRPAIVPARVSG